MVSTLPNSAIREPGEKFEGVDRNNMEGDGEFRQGGSEAHCLRQFFLGC